MSDHPLSDDELLSSHLDGELTAEEETRLGERLASEPALTTRLAAMRAAQELSASPVAPLDGLDTDRMIAAALAASSTAANVTDLAAASTRRRAWPARVATVAAGVVVLALAVPALRAIDSGDDADTAGTADSGFDAALADDGDADTAGDTALELGPAAASSPTDAADMAMDDSAPDEAEDLDQADGDVESGLGGALAYSAAQVRLFADDAGFDPLADDLGDFESIESLSASVSQTWSGYESPVAPTTTTTAPADTSPPVADEANTVDRDQLLRTASGRLDAFALEECAELADLIIDFFDGREVVAADYAASTIEGAAVTVGLFGLPDGQAVLLVIDQATCEVRDVRLN